MNVSVIEWKVEVDKYTKIRVSLYNLYNIILNLILWLFIFRIRSLLRSQKI